MRVPFERWEREERRFTGWDNVTHHVGQFGKL
jgi:hypothetical protein